MKIVTFLTYYAPHWTGLTAHAARVAEGFAAQGHEVTVVTTRHSRDLPRDEMRNGVRVVRLHPVARFSRGMITPAFPYAAAELIARHDAVQIHSPYPESLLVALLCRAMGRPLLMTHHGDIVMPAGTFNQTIQAIAYVLLRATGTLADAVTSYSQDYADHSRLLRTFRPKLHYVFPPVVIGDPDPAGVAAWRAELGLQDKLLLGFAGRWVHEKGFDYLLQALPLIRATYPNAHLVYAGERNVVYEDFYERCQPFIEQQREHITFLGLLRDPQQIANFYGMIDLFVQPSRTDMMGLVQIEALMCGTPIVVSDIPGARVVVRETGYGRLSPPYTTAGLARTLTDMLRDRAQFTPDRAKVRQLFSPERAVQQYAAILEQSLQQPRPPVLPALTPPLPSKSLTHTGGHTLHHLSPADASTLDRLLRNEADMPYRRRVFILLDYLELQAGQRVLDGGCGMGFYLLAMSRLRRLHLVGLERDSRRLHWAQRAGLHAESDDSDDSDESIHLLHGDISCTGLAPESFQRVLLSEVLEHLPDDQAALHEAYRLLEPGGILAISVPHATYPFWWDPINRIWTGLGGHPLRQGPLVGIWTDHQRLYTPADLVQRVESAGFVVETVEEATHYSFPFLHFLVYGIGKTIIERNLIPPTLRNSVDRLRGEYNAASLLHPLNAGRALLRTIDRLNDTPGGPAAAGKQSFVNVLLKARKPSGSEPNCGPNLV